MGESFGSIRVRDRARISSANSKGKRYSARVSQGWRFFSR